METVFVPVMYVKDVDGVKNLTCFSKR